MFSLGLNTPVHQAPENQWLQRFRDAVVDAVTLCRYQITLVLEDTRSVTFSAPFRFAPSAQIESHEWIEFPLTESFLPRVLGTSIADMRADSENQLWIDFSSGDTLVVAWTAMYECYEFGEGEERLII